MEEDVLKRCTRFEEEKIDRKTTVTHGYDKNGKEIYTKTVKKGLFSQKKDISFRS